MRALEDYLDNLLTIEIYKRHPETVITFYMTISIVIRSLEFVSQFIYLQVSFLELSHLSFVGDLGGKGKEGLVKKRTGSGAKAGCNFLGLLEGI